MEEGSETVDAIHRAVVVEKRGEGGFLQKDGTEAKKFSALVTTLQKITEASWLNQQAVSSLQALIQSGSGDEDLSLQPQATTSAYETHGGGIIETLENLEHEAEDEVAAARK